MRRVVFILLIILIAACGSKDKENTPVPSTNTPNLPPTLPPQQTVDPLQQETVGLPTPTSNLLITRTPSSRGPTLPPARTLDPEATSGDASVTPNPTATPRETRGTSGPTLPPVATSTMTSTATRSSVTPPTVAISPTYTLTRTPTTIPTQSPDCATFGVDLAQTGAVLPVRGEPVSVYWFPPDGPDLSYVVQLFDQFTDMIVEDTTRLTEYTFEPEVFNQSTIYYWQVTAYIDGAPLGCIPVGNELFLN